MKWRPKAIKLASPWATLASAVSGLNPPAAITGPRKILLNSCATTGACPSAMVFPTLHPRLDEMQIGQPGAIEPLCHGPEQRAGNRDVGGASSMPELREHACALSMNRIRDAFPARHMLVGVQTWSMIVAARGRCDRSGFRDDQPAVRRTLGVIFELQVARYAGPRLSS